MSFSRTELQVLVARATHECDRTEDRLMRSAYLDFQVAADYLEELMARDPQQESLFSGAAARS